MESQLLSIFKQPIGLCGIIVEHFLKKRERQELRNIEREKLIIMKEELKIKENELSISDRRSQIDEERIRAETNKINIENFTQLLQLADKYDFIRKDIKQYLHINRYLMLDATEDTKGRKN